MNASKSSAMLAVLTFAVVARAADPLDTWTPRYQSLPAVSLNSVACGNGLFVAIGSSGTNLISETSTDGAAWVTHQSGPPTQQLVYGNGLFVAADFTGPATSSDGVNWVNQQSKAWTNVRSITGIGYDNGLFVVLGSVCAECFSSTPILLISADGTNWVHRQLPTKDGASLYSIAYGNGRFVAVGPRQIVSSADAKNWGLQNTSAGLNAVAFGNDKFAAGGTDQPDLIMTSSDGITWTPHYPELGFIGAIAFGNGQFVAIDWATGGILSSADGVTWTRRQTEGWSLSRVTFGNGQFVAIGERAILTSVDGANWTLRQSGCQGQVSQVVYLNGQFVALSDCGTILISTDGATWVPRQTGPESPQSSLSAIAYGNGQFVAAADSDIVTSTDGTNWVRHSSTNQYGLNQIVYGGGQFVGWGYDRSETTAILRSSDGVNWTPRLRVGWPLGDLSSIAYGNGQFVAVGGYVGGKHTAYIATSADGIQWVQRLSPTTNRLTSVTYGNGKFVACGFGLNEFFERVAGTIITSTDGVNWVVSAVGFFSKVTYGNSQFVARRSNGAMFTSGDGMNWTGRPHGSLWWHYGSFDLTYGNGHFVLSAYATTTPELWPAGAVYGIWESGSIVNLTLAPSIGSGLVSLSLEGPSGLAYSIQSSTDLISWQNLTNVTTAQDGTARLDGLPTAVGNLFYRAKSQ